jgi:hypothetical protein
LGRDDLVFEDLQLLVIESELEFEGSIGHTSSTAEQIYNLIKHGVKVHHGTPSNGVSFWAKLGCHKITWKERVTNRGEVYAGPCLKPMRGELGSMALKRMLNVYLSFNALKIFHRSYSRY